MTSFYLLDLSYWTSYSRFIVSVLAEFLLFCCNILILISFLLPTANLAVEGDRNSLFIASLRVSLISFPWCTKAFCQVFTCFVRMLLHLTDFGLFRLV